MAAWAGAVSPLTDPLTMGQDVEQLPRTYVETQMPTVEQVRAFAEGGSARIQR